MKFVKKNQAFVKFSKTSASAAQAVINRVQKLGLKEDYLRDAGVHNTLHYLLIIPLLPPWEIVDNVPDVRAAVNVDNPHKSQLKQLVDTSAGSDQQAIYRQR